MICTNEAFAKPGYFSFKSFFKNIWHLFFMHYKDDQFVMPSTVIHKYEYCYDKQLLKIEFVTRKIYVYQKEPPEVYIGMKDAFSKGIFFNDNIRDKYAYKRLN